MNLTTYLSKYPFHEISDFTMWMKYMHFKNKKGRYRLSTKNNLIILKTNKKFKILLFLFKPLYQHKSLSRKHWKVQIKFIKYRCKYLITRYTY